MVGFRLSAFSVRIHGYQYPDLEDYWDGNWLTINARLETSDSVTSLVGDPSIRTDELRAFADSVEKLSKHETDSAELETMEPYVKLVIFRSEVGAFAQASIIPNDEAEPIECRFAVKSEEIVKLREDLFSAVSSFPVRGMRDDP